MKDLGVGELRREKNKINREIERKVEEWKAGEKESGEDNKIEDVNYYQSDFDAYIFNAQFDNVDDFSQDYYNEF